MSRRELRLTLYGATLDDLDAVASRRGIPLRQSAGLPGSDPADNRRRAVANQLLAEAITNALSS